LGWDIAYGDFLGEASVKPRTSIYIWNFRRRDKVRSELSPFGPDGIFDTLFGMHEIRFARRVDLEAGAFQVGSTRAEMILKNAHDGSRA
jgi:hypothetical protein